MIHSKNKLLLIPWLMGMFPLFVLAMATLALGHLANVFASRIYYIALAWLDENYHYIEWLRRDLADCETILELGCGSNSPILKIGYGKRTDAIDIWHPYIKKHNKKGDYRNCWPYDVLEFDFPVKAYDAVVMFDVLEHLPAERVREIDLFGKLERCAKKKIILFTPNGYVENDEIDGNPYQAHLSAWQPEDYKARGYKVLGGTGFRFFFVKASCPKRPQSVFYPLGMISQPLVYHFPRLALHSYAVKEIK